MNKLRQVLGEFMGSPMQNMSYVEYFQYVNQAGKITQRSTLDLLTILYTYAEEQEKINERYEAQFTQIAGILEKLVDKKLEKSV